MKKWYKQPYFDARAWILENFDKLNLTSEETLVILLVDFAKENKKKLSYDYLCSKLNVNTKQLDKILSSLVAKHYLSINVNTTGVGFDIDGIFEFDMEKYEIVENKSIFNMCEELLNRPLTPNELQKVNDLLEKYNENDFIDAIRVAEAYRKASLAYVEGVLRNGKQ